jgi:CTP:molybdopterin cytidylyltransferase MocA
MKLNISALILAAGHSSRMGKNKFALELAKGLSFLENIVSAYVKIGCDSIVVVTNRDGVEYFNTYLKNKYRKLRLVENYKIDKGRSYSIKLGLKKTENGNYVFIHNVDNPFADTKILKMMYTGIGNHDFVRLINNGRGGHPVLISPKIAEAILKTKENDFNLKTVLESHEGIKIEVADSNILININTVDDYEKFTFAQSGKG